MELSKRVELAVGNEFSYRSPHVVLNQFDQLRNYRGTLTIISAGRIKKT